MAGRSPRGTISATPNPVRVRDESIVGRVALSWVSYDTEAVEVRVGGPNGPLLSRTGPTGEAVTGNWVTNGTIFYLQNVSHEAPLRPANTLDTVTVHVITGRGLILLFHRVADIQPDSWSLCVSPSHFAEHLEVLRMKASPVHLRDLTTVVDEDTSPAPVVVTFDDGYADNLHSAKPALDRFEVPATVFVAAGYIGGQREFWWDELEGLILLSPDPPDPLRLTVRNETHEWRLAPSGRNARAAQEVAHITDGLSRNSLFRSVYQLLKPLSEAEQQHALQQILDWVHIGRRCRPSHRSLDHDELLELASDGLVEIGAHSISHPYFQAMETASQQHEIVESKRVLEHILGKAVTSFAYPYGSHTRETVTAVERGGFARACTDSRRCVRRDTPRFQLPRVHVDDCDGEEFARLLSEWFEK